MRWAAAVASLIILALVMFLTGCTTVQVMAGMPLPPAPQITFQSCKVAEVATICLSEADANALRVWMDQLNAYSHAVKRLHDANEPVVVPSRP